jgi:hypothetical protein
MSGSLLGIGLLGRNQFKEALTSFLPHHAAPGTSNAAGELSDRPNHAYQRRAAKTLRELIEGLGAVSGAGEGLQGPRALRLSG